LRATFLMYRLSDTKNKMKYFQHCLPFFATVALFSCSRNKCGEQFDCADLTGVEFRIVRAADGVDLVFGPMRVYDKNAFKFYTLKGADTVFFDYNFYYATRGTLDTTIGVTFPRGTAAAFVRLSNGDVDTLSMAYKTNTTNCGCMTTNISSVRVNNSTDVQGPTPLVQLRK
jgi:hypothetical protein